MAIRAMSQARQTLWLVALMVLTSALAVWLGYDETIHVLGGEYDSLRYLSMAESLFSGQWLGSYTHLTLIRPPVYPLLLALNSILEWRLHLLQQGLYLISILLLVLALRSWRIPAWKCALIFIACAFHPIGLSASTFVATEALYIPATTALLASSLGLLGAARGRLPVYGAWLLLMTLSLVVFWGTRPEGVWVLLFLGVVLILLWRRLREGLPARQAVMRFVLAPGLSALATVGINGYYAHVNHQHYGVAVVHELAEPNFVEAMGWLTRLAPDDRRRQVPVTRQALAVGYTVSPTLSELEPYLAQHVQGKGWSKSGCDYAGICDELAGGWFLWAVREGVSTLGYYASAPQAADFYREVSHEIGQACRSGAVPCSANLTGNMLAPPLGYEDLPQLALSAVRMVWLTVSLHGLTEALDTLGKMPFSRDLEARYERITHDQGERRRQGLSIVERSHIAVFAALQSLAVPWMLLWACRRGWRRARGLSGAGEVLSPGWLAALLGVFIIGRWGLVTYVDAMSFPANIRYLLVVYPALVTLVVVTLPTVDFGKRFKQAQ